MTTDTPRTDAAFGDNLVKCYCPRCIVGVHDDIQLAAQYRAHAEWRERAERAEAERDEARKDLIKNLQTTGGMPWREWSAECAKETRRADENLERAEKAEAEVERLRDAILKAINAFDKSPWGYGIASIFSMLEDTLNPTDK